jgi:hypothetical protein
VHQAAIRALNPTEHSIRYEQVHWRRWLGADSDLEYILAKYPASLSRGEVSDLALKVCSEPSDTWNRRLFIAVMMWGFGTVGYGAYRTSKMLQPADLLLVLRRTVALATKGKIAAAYDALSLPYCGHTFRTKYLYFIGLGCQLEPLPLILDSILIERIGTLLGNSSGKWRNVAGYLRYVELMNQWASYLGCKPDSIELFLFSYGANDQIKS